MQRARYDYVLIWGHGLKYWRHILQIIRNHEAIEIVKILHHRPKSMKKLVKAVYSYDYAPFHHLKGKTRYLLNTRKEVIFIFVRNSNPNEDYFGEAEFRHIESRTVKALKEEMRDKFNDRVDGARTEDHVIHASDNEEQTHYILKYLGFDGVHHLKSKKAVLDLPYHLGWYKKITLKRVRMDDLVCNIVLGDRDKYQIETTDISSSPHYRALIEGAHIYRDYIDRFLGGPLTDDYSAERYMKLVRDFEYLAEPHQAEYITTRPLNEKKLVIVDGLHRAAIMRYRRIKSLPVAILG